MKLLIVTQTVDTQDPVLGFFVRWIEEFAKHAEEVTVICLKKGKYELPKNVRVFSLGKEPAGAARSAAPAGERVGSVRPRAKSTRLAKRLTYTLRFLNLVWRERAHYDSVFVHMNPEYIAIAGGLWRLMGKHISLWYTHKSVTLTLRAAVFYAHTIFTASPESFRLASKKVLVVGHGIDMDQFAESLQRREHHPHRAPQARDGGGLRIITIGRFSATKRIKEMLAAFDVPATRGTNFTFTIAGAPATGADREYEKQVRRATTARPYANKIEFIGAVGHKEAPGLLARHDVFLNLSTTGSMDKAVLEAIASGAPAVTTNIAFRELLASTPGLFVETDTPEAIATALVSAAGADIHAITTEVRHRYALPHLIKTICHTLKT